VVSPTIPRLKLGTASGSGPGGKVAIGDIQAKLSEIRGEVDETTEKAKPVAVYVGVGAAVLLIVLAFVLGRRRGRSSGTWVEVRRL
jgi:hypothetical protein